MNEINPFRRFIQVADSSYYGMQDYITGKKRLINLVTGAKPSAMVNLMHESLKGMCGNKDYVCTGSIMVMDKGMERLLVYDSMDTCDINLVAHDLYEYILDYNAGEVGNDLTAMICFTKPESNDVDMFRVKLWNLLFRLSARQNDYFPWAKGYSPVTADKNFALSFGEVALFLAAFHNASPRTSRRFAYPVLVINPHEQFEKLKREGKFEPMTKCIRKRDLELDKIPNTCLANFNVQSEWSQYDASDKPSECPFQSLATLGMATRENPATCPYKKTAG